MSAFAALAVASPCAYFVVYESTSSAKAPEHHEFKRAAVMTDLPKRLMSALTKGLSQFGINLPNVPSLTGATGTTGTGLTSPGLGTTTPDLGTSGLGTSGLGTSGLGTSGLTPAATTPGLTPSTGLTTPGANPALTSPLGTTPTAGLTPTTGSTELPITTPAGTDGTYPILGDPSLGGGGGG